MKYGFIGCGNMGGALAQAVSKAVGGEKVLLCDLMPGRADSMAQKLGAQACDLMTALKTSDYLFIGVKPQGIEGLFEQLRPQLMQQEKKPVLVSMAAGVSIRKIEELSGCEAHVIRIMPNTPASVGEGMILYCANAFATAGEKQGFVEAFACAGLMDELAEEKIDAASAISGCGPAYVYLFAEALADGAVACGLPRDKANLYAAQTLLGAAKMLLESGKHPGQLKDEVCSPGGTTIQGVRALESGAFRAAAQNAVIAAYEKTLALKK